MLCRLNGKVEIHPKFGVYLQDLRLILKKRLLYLIGFAANTGNSPRSHTFKLLNTGKKLNKIKFQHLIFSKVYEIITFKYDFQSFDRLPIGF